MTNETKHAHLVKMIDEIDNHAIILLDQQGNIQTWNNGAERIKGYQANEIIHQNFRVFYPEADRQVDLAGRLLEEAALRGRAYHEGWRLRKDQSRFWGGVTISALRDHEGQLLGYAKITQDLTQRMQAEATTQAYARHLATKNKELEHFVYIASHDLQEPLLNVSNFVQLLTNECETSLDSNARFYLDVIYQCTNRMQELVRGLLDLSVIGQQQQFVITDCQAVMEAVEQDLLTQIQASGAQVLYANLPVVEANLIGLRQTFLNLVSNAIKFRKPDVTPIITISAVAQEEHWLFAVSDNGIGINPHHFEKIFLLFQRLHDRNTYPGNGIGLTYCKHVIESRGGKMSVESTPGQGSTFSFTIPF